MFFKRRSDSPRGISTRADRRAAAGSPAPSADSVTGPVSPTSTTDTGLSALVDSCRQIASLRDVDAIQRLAVSHAIALTSAEVGAFVVCGDEPDDDRSRIGDAGVRGRFAFQSHPQLFTMSEPRGPSFLAALRDRTALCDILTDEPSVALSPVAVAAVPAIARGRMTGMLVVIRSADDPFGNTALEILNLLAPVAGSAIANADATGHEEIDELTELANRRRLDRDFVDLAREGRVGVASVRVDRFAALDRIYGRSATDELLRQIAKTVTVNIRPEDVAYRADDHEFVILLPGADKVEAAWVAERVRQAIAAVTITGLGRAEHPTASIGVTAAEHADPQELAERARAAMLEAEELGCNRVVLDEAV